MPPHTYIDVARLWAFLIGVVSVSLLDSTNAAAATSESAPDDASSPANLVPEDAWHAVYQRLICVKLKGGKEVTGRVISNDTNSVRLFLSDNRVVIVDKAEVEYLRALDGSEMEASAPIAPSPSPVEAEPEGFRKSGGYLLLSPGIGRQSYALVGDVYGASNPKYTLVTVSLAAGIFRATKSALAVALGLAIQDAIGQSDGASDLHINLLRIGPEIRLGGSNKRWFAYGLFDFHAVVERQRERSGPSSTGVTYGGFGGSFGAGAQRFFGKRFFSGFELRVPVEHEFSKGNYAAANLVALNVQILLGANF